MLAKSLFLFVSVIGLNLHVQANSDTVPEQVKSSSLYNTNNTESTALDTVDENVLESETTDIDEQIDANIQMDGGQICEVATFPLCMSVTQ
jgi:hypothetical protein